MTISYPYQNNLYLNIINRCTNNCTFCLKKLSWNFAGVNLKLTREPSRKEIIEDAIKNYKGESQIVFCGIGEPLMRLDDVLAVSQELKKQLKASLRIDTNGQAKVLYPQRNVAKELSKVIDAISISLNAENEEKYNQLCRPVHSNAYPQILEFIKDCRKYFEVTLTVLRLASVDIKKCRKIAEDLKVHFRIREFIE